MFGSIDGLCRVRSNLFFRVFELRGKYGLILEAFHKGIEGDLFHTYCSVELFPFNPLQSSLIPSKPNNASVGMIRRVESIASLMFLFHMCVIYIDVF